MWPKHRPCRSKRSLGGNTFLQSENVFFHERIVNNVPKRVLEVLRRHLVQSHFHVLLHVNNVQRRTLKACEICKWSSHLCRNLRNFLEFERLWQSQNAHFPSPNGCAKGQSSPAKYVGTAILMFCQILINFTNKAWPPEAAAGGPNPEG